MTAAVLRQGGLVVALLCLVAPAAAPAATVVLPEGGRLTVAPSPVVGTELLDTEVRLETLGWALTDPRGRTVDADLVPDTLRLAGGDPPVLAVQPADGVAFLLHPHGDLASSGVLLRAWTGRGFTEPAVLPTGDAPARQPTLAFLPEGDAVLAWATPGPAPALRLQHAQLTAAGTQALESFVEVHDVLRFLAPVGDGVQVRPGLGHVAVDAARETAYAVLASEQGTDVGILGVRLRIIDDIWGGSAAPVPVTVSSSSLAPAGHESQGGTVDPGLPAASWTVRFERLRLLDHDLYVWAEDGSTLGLLFRAGVASPLLSSPSEAEPGRLAVLRAAWREVARSDGERAGSTSRRGGER